MGPAWIFLNPLISSFMYAIVFGGIAGIGTDGLPVTTAKSVKPTQNKLTVKSCK